MTMQFSIKALTISLTIIIVGVLGTFFLSEQVNKQLKNQAHLKLQNTANQISIRFQDAIDLSLNDLQALQAFYSIKSQSTFQNEFDQYMTLLDIKNRNYIHGLSWVPLVTDDQRDDFEQQIREQQPGFIIKELDSKGNLIPRKREPYYTPVTYLSSSHINRAPQGFDLSSNEIRRRSLEYARDNGEMTTTAKITLVQEKEESYGFLTIAPVYKQGVIPNNLQKRKDELIGYVIGVYRINSLIVNAQQQANLEGLSLTLYDLDENNGGLLYGQKNEDSSFLFDINIPDRKWQLGVTLNKELRKNIDSPSIVYWILIVGFLVSVLLAISVYAFQTSHTKSLKIVALSQRLKFHNKELKQTVEHKTQELENKNSQLKSHIKELTEQRKTLSELITASQQAQAVVEKYAGELANSNKDLDDFAYIASHDLKAPLRGIDQLASWVSEDIQKGEFEEVLVNVAMIRSRVQRLETLLNDLLSYSRINRQDNIIKTIDCNSLVNELFTLISPPPNFVLSILNTLPVFSTVNAPFEQVLLNLLNNAVKHHDKNEGSIQIQCDNLDGFYLFKIKDNGPGIDSNYHDEVFKMFRTLKPRDDIEGSGMGLALIKKVVEHYGGDVYLESSLGQGSIFSFTWPKVIKNESEN